MGAKADLAATVSAGGVLAGFFPEDSKWVIDDLTGRVAPGADAASTATAVVSGGTQVVFAALPTTVSRGNSPALPHAMATVLKGHAATGTVVSCPCSHLANDTPAVTTTWQSRQFSQGLPR